MLYRAIKHIYPNITEADFGVRNDGTGDRVASWSYGQPQPTQGDIDTAIAGVLAADAAVAYIPARRDDYYARMAALTGWDGSYAEMVAFWIDEIMGWAEQEIAAGRLQSTPGLDALLQIRSQVKSAHPKP